MDVYHYAGNNPVKLVDPDGRELERVRLQLLYNNTNRNINSEKIIDRIKQNDSRLTPNGNTACFYRALQSIAEKLMQGKI